MSTANFRNMDYDLPLIVGGFDEDEEANEMQFEDAENLADEINEELEHYEVSVDCGYYEGFQFWVEENNWREYYDEEEEKEEEILADEELKKIRNWLEDLKYEYGFTELKVCGRFSSGETLYSRVA